MSGESGREQARNLMMSALDGELSSDERAGLELPGVAAVGILHELRHPVVESRRQIAFPHRGWFDRVAVRRDDVVLALAFGGHGAPPGIDELNEQSSKARAAKGTSARGHYTRSGPGWGHESLLDGATRLTM